MTKQLYYYCPSCYNSWTDDYSSEYGYCDDECGLCGSQFSPFTNKTDWNKSIKNNEKKLRKIKISLEVISPKNLSKETVENQIDKMLESLDDAGIIKRLSKIKLK